MVTDQFKHDVNSYMKGQADKLLAHQTAIASSIYTSRTGSLTQALQSQPQVQDMRVDIPYPKHIRFLDLKKGKPRKDGSQRKKKNYKPIYNRYVYGYLKSDIWKMLMSSIPKKMIRTIEETISSVK